MTDEEFKQQAANALIANALRGGSPSARVESAPSNQKYIAFIDTSGQLSFVSNPNFDSSTVQPTTFPGPYDSRWALNPQTGQYEQVIPAPEAKAQQDAIAAQVAGLRRDELLANEARGIGFLTDDQARTAARLEADTTINRDTLNQQIRAWEAENRRADATAELAQRTGAAQIDLYGGQTAQAQATAQATIARLGPQNAVDQAQAATLQAQANRQNVLLPGEVAAADQALRVAQANEAAIRQQAGLYGAQTAETAARAAQITSQTPIQNQLTQAQATLADAEAAVKVASMPSDIALAQANADMARANVARLQQQMRQPTPLAADITSAVRSYISPTGEIVNTPNPAFQPRTQFDVATSVGQLQTQAQQMRDQLTTQVGAGTLSQEQANTQFDRWWQQNVGPQQAALGQATAQIAREQQRLDEEQAARSMQVAQAAGTQAINAFNAQVPYMAGPGFAQVAGPLLNAVATANTQGLQGMDLGQGMTFKGPNLQDLARNATMQALRTISPTAAAATGSPMPQVPPGLDVAAMLNRTSFGQQQPQAQQPITINIGGVGQQQPPAPPPPQPVAPAEIPEAFIPRRRPLPLGTWITPSTPMMTLPNGQPGYPIPDYMFTPAS